MKHDRDLEAMVDPGVLAVMLGARMMQIRRPPPIDCGVDVTEPVTLIVSAPPAPKTTVCSGTSRNEPCPCGSGKKLKRCCGISREKAINVEKVK
jgi:hypothetical protein